MRVILQDGAVDIPYEKFVFGVVDGEIRIAKDLVLTRDEEDIRIIAKYSSQEKALKAMEMLRKTWLEESTEFENGIYQKNCVFRFPADDEVEA